MAPSAAQPAYLPPVDRLLRLGEVRSRQPARDYAKVGIGAEHVQELIRMATDEVLYEGADGSQAYGPIHAWRALGELRAEAAVVPLLGLLWRIWPKHDDFVGEELPIVLGRIGGPAMDPVTAYLADPAHDEWARIAAAKALAEVGGQNPEFRAECVARLVSQLARFAEQPELLNAYIISPLLDLKAVEALPAIEQACASGRVDETTFGDFEDVEIILGLKLHRTHPRRPNALSEWGAEIREAMGIAEGEEMQASVPAVAAPKVGRNDPCPCGSGKKYKKCCGS